MKPAVASAGMTGVMMPEIMSMKLETRSPKLFLPRGAADAALPPVAPTSLSTSG